MANSAQILISTIGSVNGLNINQSGNSSIIPSGSVALGESIFLTTGVYTLIQTGSNFGTASSITVFNTSTGSISLAISASGTVSSLGTILGQSNSASFNGNNGIPTSIAWNNTFSGLYANASAPTYGVFVIIPQ